MTDVELRLTEPPMASTKLMHDLNRLGSLERMGMSLDMESQFAPAAVGSRR